MSKELKRRKLEYAILEEDWGSNDHRELPREQPESIPVPETERRPPALSGNGSTSLTTDNLLEIRNIEEEEGGTSQQQFNNNIVVDGGDMTGRGAEEEKVGVLDDQGAHNDDRAMTSGGRIVKQREEDMLSINVVGISDATWVGEKCIFDRDKKCVRHGIQATIYQVTSKKWSYLNNKKSYGWKTRKVEKLACRMRSSGPIEYQKSTNTTIFPESHTDLNFSGGVENVQDSGFLHDRGLLTFLSEKSDN